jgi:hypothetical protein
MRLLEALSLVLAPPVLILIFGGLFISAIRSTGKKIRKES